MFETGQCASMGTYHDPKDCTTHRIGGCQDLPPTKSCHVMPSPVTWLMTLALRDWCAACDMILCVVLVRPRCGG